MKVIDVAVFMLIWHIVATAVVANSQTFGFQTELFKPPGTGIDTGSKWAELQGIANAIMTAGLVAGTVVSAVFGFYFSGIVFATAAFIINVIPQLRDAFLVLPYVLDKLGVPIWISSVATGAYTIVLVISLYILLSGKGE